MRDKCGADYDTVVYFYLDDVSDDNIKQSQNVQSNILSSLKEEYGAGIMLIPLPIDMGISVVDSFVELKGISEYPTILINEEIKLEGLHSYEDIEKLI